MPCRLQKLTSIKQAPYVLGLAEVVSPLIHVRLLHVL